MRGFTVRANFEQDRDSSPVLKLFIKSNQLSSRTSKPGKPQPVKIARIFAHRVELPLVEGSYKWSGGKAVSVFDSTLVGVETACGLIGYGEVCPLGPFYLPAYAEGVRAGLERIRPPLLGFDPREISKLNHRMDAALKGHPYVKSGIDIACWDILGKATGLPVSLLLGGRFGESVRLYRAISRRPADEMAANVAAYRAEGYTRFQLKVGGDPDQDIERIRGPGHSPTDGSPRRRRQHRLDPT